MKIYKFSFFLIFFVIFLKINFSYGTEIKILALVNNKIITNQDLINEKVILNYLYNNRINTEQYNKIAMDNIIEQEIKLYEIKKNDMLISDSETLIYTKTILNNLNKSLEDFREKIKNKTHENYFIKKVKIEVSWNKFISIKFRNQVDINIDEVIATTSTIKDIDEKIKYKILIEKNKKLRSLSDSYFNEIKNKALIKFL